MKLVQFYDDKVPFPDGQVIAATEIGITEQVMKGLVQHKVHYFAVVTFVDRGTSYSYAACSNQRIATTPSDPSRSAEPLAKHAVTLP